MISSNPPNERIIKTSDVVLKSFHDFWVEYRKKNDYTTFVLKGGRNSGKSTTASEAFIMDLAEYPINGLCIRKVERTIRESQFEQLKEAARLLGIEDQFKFDLSPLRITFKPRGNYTIFRGADDPIKIKSIKTSAFPIARMWIEELAEFKTEDEIDTIVASILRGTLPENIYYKMIYTYNPPKRKQHWLNKIYESHVIPDGAYIHHSSYLDNPYLSEQTLIEIESTKKRNERKYRWMYMGDPSGGGIVPFENLIFRKITDEEIKIFDNIRQGLDFGYAVDPLAFIKLQFDKKKRTIYIFDEIFGIKLSNRKVAEEIIKRKYNTTKIIADSAEPKSIAEFKEHNVTRIVGARKGEGSVEFGEKWLDDLDAIIIDPDRCPGCAKEFEEIDYKIDKDGNPKPQLMDKGDNSIAAVRYALEDDMRSGKITAGQSIL